MNAPATVSDWSSHPSKWADTPCLVQELSREQLASPQFVQRWDALARIASDPNPYLESWFLLPSLEQFDAAKTVTVLSITREDELLGLLAMARRSDYYGKPIPHLSNWIHPNIFLGSPLARAGSETAFWEALITWADDHAGSSAFLHLSEFALNTDLHCALEAVLVRLGRSSGIVDRYDRAVLEATGPSEDYRLTHHSKKKRKDMRRRLGKLREAGAVEFHWHQDATDVDAWIDNFLFIEASGWKGEAGSALACSSDTASLFRDSIEGAAERGRVTRLSLTLDGRPIAMLANFVCEHAAFGFKTAFDDAFSEFSPGILLEDEYINELDRGTFAWCDSCAAPNHSLMNAIWGQRRPIGKISIPIGGKVRRMLGQQIIRLEQSRNAQDNTK